VGKVLLPQYATPAAAEWHKFLFKALLASLDALDTADRVEQAARQHFRDLAVFGEDARIPRAALHALWSVIGLDSDTIDRIIDKFVSKALLSTNERNDTVWMHDLVYFYVRAEVRDRMPALHAQLVQGYEQRCKGRCVDSCFSMLVRLRSHPSVVFPFGTWFL
jgi:hypothetical protein